MDFDLVISNISQHVRLDRAELDLFTSLLEPGYHLLIIGMCIALIITGSDKYSIDGLISKG